jgi:hypothetical protein
MAAQSSPDRHIAAAKLRLGHLAGLSARTDDSEHSILEAAQDKCAAIQVDLDKLHQRALTNPEAARQYESMLVERGQLENIIAHARLVTG